MHSVRGIAYYRRPMKFCTRPNYHTATLWGVTATGERREWEKSAGTMRTAPITPVGPDAADFPDTQYSKRLDRPFLSRPPAQREPSCNTPRDACAARWPLLTSAPFLAGLSQGGGAGGAWPGPATLQCSARHGAGRTVSRGGC